MEPIRRFDAHYTELPDEDERECPNEKCTDGVIHGIDANGSEVMEKCPDSSHWSSEIRKQIKDDFVWECMREEML